MQREKVYNLKSNAYFNCLLFVFKTSKILSDQFSSVQKLITWNFACYLKRGKPDLNKGTIDQKSCVYITKLYYLRIFFHSCLNSLVSQHLLLST